MKRQSLVVLLGISFIAAIAGSVQAGITLSAQSRNLVKGTLEDDGTKKTITWFSAKLEGELITVMVAFSGKSITLRKSPDELYVSSDSDGSNLETLQEDEKLILDELAGGLEERFQNPRPLHRKLVCLLRHLASWPPGMPLSLSMDSSSITIGGESTSREIVDEIRFQSLARNLETASSEGEPLSPEAEGWLSLCGVIGARAHACYPTSLKPLEVECKYVLVGGTTCRGRCGSTCTGLCTGARYTADCLNHDRCADVYGISHRFCNFIFPACFDDCENAPDCQDIPGVWIVQQDYGCDGGTDQTVSWNIYPDHTLTTSTGCTGKWAMSNRKVIVTYATGWKPKFSGRLRLDGLVMSGFIVNDPNGTSCWSARKTSAVLPKK